jgi:hypothetical protein
MLVFWVVTPCGLAARYQAFGGTYCLHLQGPEALKTEAVCSAKYYLPTSPHAEQPEDGHRHHLLREKLKSHILMSYK